MNLYVGGGKIICHGGEAGPKVFDIDYDRGIDPATGRPRDGRQFTESYLPVAQVVSAVSQSGTYWPARAAPLNFARR